MYELKVLQRVREVPQSAWDALAREHDSPFVEWTWLDCLEQTGCVGGKSGWWPQHLALFRDDVLVAAVPFYLKSHSEGEFVFDWSWAEFSERCRVPYYPKLVAAVPFTPATGARVLLAPSERRGETMAVLAAAMRKLAERTRASSIHVLFPRADEAHAWAEQGFVHRLGFQFHWHNRSYESLADFLGELNSKRRHQVRREMSQPAKDGIRIETLDPAEITPAIVRTMYDLYASTVRKFYWGRRYLTRDFFESIAACFGERLSWVVARRRDDVIAGAFNVKKGRRLYGRYWGAHEDIPFLHFNVCYYHGIAQCIREGLEAFEPGAGGEHKLARGFLPTITHSTHWMADGRSHDAVAAFLDRERRAVVEHATRIAADGPFKNPPPVAEHPPSLTKP